MFTFPHASPALPVATTAFVLLLWVFCQLWVYVCCLVAVCVHTLPIHNVPFSHVHMHFPLSRQPMSHIHIPICLTNSAQYTISHIHMSTCISHSPSSQRLMCTNPYALWNPTSTQHPIFTFPHSHSPSSQCPIFHISIRPRMEKSHCGRTHV